jgi:hypothetical protein
MAKFAAAASPYLQNPKLPAIAIVTSQAAQYSVQGELQIAAQRNAVRALAYGLQQPCYIIAENHIDKLGSPKLVILPSAQALHESTWQALLAYVKNGGNLLVTGPVSRDEHWHLVDRYTPLGLKATTEPLTFHSASMIHPVFPSAWVLAPLTFNQQAQQALEYVRFEDGSRMKELPLGHGQLFWDAYPVELSETTSAAVPIYEGILIRSQNKSPSELQKMYSNDILLLQIDLQDAVLHILESESDSDITVKLTNDTTGTELKLNLPSQHAALALIDKHTKQIVAKYGF